MAAVTTATHNIDDVLEKTTEQNFEAVSDSVGAVTHTDVTEREPVSIVAAEETLLGPLGGTEQASVTTSDTTTGTFAIPKDDEDKAPTSENVTRPPMWLDGSAEEVPTVSADASYSKTTAPITTKVSGKPQQKTASSKQTLKISPDVGWVIHFFIS
ncbi:unnamed protein product [Cylicostephanus goldi]|uniref:Uncharacterized protein n=1 Tax=Cylicostephanus goldi TaxID=71465 RepID=A0A3P7MY77_CYLGO|nr:unnamed protein product [Cylicostephanus goldi]